MLKAVRDRVPDGRPDRNTSLCQGHILVLLSHTWPFARKCQDTPGNLAADGNFLLREVPRLQGWVFQRAEGTW